MLQPGCLSTHLDVYSPDDQCTQIYSYACTVLLEYHFLSNNGSGWREDAEEEYSCHVSAPQQEWHLYAGPFHCSRVSVSYSLSDYSLHQAVFFRAQGPSACFMSSYTARVSPVFRACWTLVYNFPQYMPKWAKYRACRYKRLLVFYMSTSLSVPMGF